MADVPEELRALLVALSLLLVFAFAWVSMGPMPRVARILGRLCLIGLAIFPIALIALFGDRGLLQSERPTRSAQTEPQIVSEAPPKSRQRPRSVADDPAASPSSTTVEPKAARDVDGELAADPPAAGPPPGQTSTGEAASRGIEMPSVPAAPAPPIAAAPAEEPLAGAGEPPPSSAEVSAAREAPAAPAPVAPAPDADRLYDIVPVFFGTDRGAATGTPRLDFASTRGRRLELGRALVTVPKAHEVPMVERPWVIRIPLTDIVLYAEAEDPAKHFTLKELEVLTRADLLRIVRERLAASNTFKDHALVFIHGFNTTFQNGLYRTAQIAYDLKFDGAAFLYSWPSGGGVASYTYDRESAGQSVPFMREFLELVVKESGAKSVSIIAHSMGNQPFLQVLKDLKSSSPPGVLINQVILAAPDVDRDNFENIAREIGGLAQGITLYVAANDRALGISRRFHGGVPRAGDVPQEGPIVVPGVDTIDVTAVSTDSFGINHSGYAENNALLGDLRALIRTGERPPEKRTPFLERVGTPAGAYWKFQPR